MATSPKKTSVDDDELPAECDFSTLKGAVRGKYAAAYRAGLRTVMLDNDIAGAFSDEKAVNAALRAYLKQRKPRVRTTRPHQSA